MVMIMGTSTCHMVLAREERAVPGMCGYVQDGVLPGLLRLRGGPVRASATTSAGSSSTPCRRRTPAGGSRARPRPPCPAPGEGGRACRVGESGLLALDWWNGNRSVLVDAGVGGLLVGATLATTPEEIYRALIEATAYGTRIIIETFEAHGVPVRRHRGVRRAGREEPADHADLRRRDRSARSGSSASEQTPALGSAMFARGRGRRGGRRPRDDRGRRRGRWPGSSDDVYEPDPGQPGRPTTSSTASTSGSTTTSGAARTT